jgi:hypothetical protein
MQHTRWARVAALPTSERNDMTTQDGDDSRPWHTSLYGILHQEDTRHIWLLRSPGGWSLPVARVDQAVYPGDTGSISTRMAEALRADVIAYRYTRHSFDEQHRAISGVYLLEPRTRGVDPASDGQWFEHEALDGLEFAPTEHRLILQEALDNVAAGDSSGRRAPWLFPGWFQTAEAWILDQLRAIGFQSIGPVEQVRSWGLSCVLRAPTTTEAIFFKTAINLPMFVNEPLLLKHLSGWYPEVIPCPLAIDAERRWMLMPDWGPTIGWNAPAERRAAIYRAMAEIQIDAAQRVDDLLRVGCIDRRLDVLVRQIDPLLEESHVLGMLSAEQRARFRTLGPRLKAMCEELAGYNIPASLMHGDLHPGNVATPGGRLLIFDWTDASIAHPFFDLMHLFFNDAATEARLRDDYLQQWTAFAPMERLQAAWRLARPLIALHHTVSYESIIANLEPRILGENASGLTFFGRKVLEFMQDDA